VPKNLLSRLVILQTVTFINREGHKLHGQLRAVNNNILLSQIKREQCAGKEEQLISYIELLQAYRNHPSLIENTIRLLQDCSFHFDFKINRNKQTFTGNRYDDKELLRVLALDGLSYRYGKSKKMALQRVEKELEIIDKLGFSSYFLITH